MNITKRIICMLLVVVLFASVTSMTAFAKGDMMSGVGWVTASALRLRSEPSTNSEILATAMRNEVVVVHGKTGDWYKVTYNLKVGYMHSDYLNVLTKENAELGYGKITGNDVNLRSGAGTSYSKVVQGDKGEQVYIVGIENGWYKVIFKNKVCYIRSDFVDLAEIP